VTCPSPCPWRKLSLDQKLKNMYEFLSAADSLIPNPKHVCYATTSLHSLHKAGNLACLFLLLNCSSPFTKTPRLSKDAFLKTSLGKTHVCCCSSSLRHYQSKCCVVLRRGVSLQFGCVTDKGNIMYRTNVERTAATFNISISRHGFLLLLFYTTNYNISYL
jgi:hypothetical protein